MNKNNNSDFSMFSKWTIRKISFIGILIAISVVFLIIGATFMPLITIPSYKISFIGLPIKISGFIFGPLIGGLVGLISDILSFMFLPTYFNPLFTLAAVVDGVVAGLIGWLFLKLLKYYFGGDFQNNIFEVNIFDYLIKLDILKKQNKNNDKKIKKIENKIIFLNEKKKKIKVFGSINTLLNINLIVGLSILSLFVLFIVFLIGFKIDQSIINGGIIKNRFVLLGLMISGYGAMMIFLSIMRFKMSAKHYLVIVPIVVFSALIELINVPLLSLGDSQSFTNDSKNIFVFIFQHTFFSPLKIWFNMFIIFFTYNIISPLINKNNDICY
ncbi:ECF transporter S component [Mycoplasmopsis lipofaciens]|uniref:ECF transporter S component n=1 Tax=Mycoplasmopsis lipofaciens TaxID=114884 RepID=UPI0004809A7C|nr:ECF transporter S component [Mycoplasmopsis lipofaciens]